MANMGSKISRLFPSYEQALEHQGLYLKQDLRSQAESIDSAFVYANFIVSLDGRIAVPGLDGESTTLATQITNERDWRLFQELAVQSDVIITSGRYLREYTQGPKQELLQVYDDPKFEDLGDWRRAKGLSDYPAVTVVSRSLDFNVPTPLQEPGRDLLIFTSETANPERKRILASQGAQVIEAGEQDVDGSMLVSDLHKLGYKLIYSTAGPNILHMLLSGKVLTRLYLTIALRLLAGDEISTIAEGQLLKPPADFELKSLFLDPDGPGGTSQLYGTFDRIPKV
jgi:riboflavin biosynthesis pyrimidine reductase